MLDRRRRQGRQRHTLRLHCDRADALRRGVHPVIVMRILAVVFSRHFVVKVSVLSHGARLRLVRRIFRLLLPIRRRHLHGFLRIRRPHRSHPLRHSIGRRQLHRSLGRHRFLRSRELGLLIAREPHARPDFGFGLLMRRSWVHLLGDHGLRCCLGPDVSLQFLPLPLLVSVLHRRVAEPLILLWRRPNRLLHRRLQRLVHGRRVVALHNSGRLLRRSLIDFWLFGQHFPLPLLVRLDHRQRLRVNIIWIPSRRHRVFLFDWRLRVPVKWRPANDAGHVLLWPRRLRLSDHDRRHIFVFRLVRQLGSHHLAVHANSHIARQTLLLVIDIEVLPLRASGLPDEAVLNGQFLTEAIDLWAAVDILNTERVALPLQRLIVLAMEAVDV